MINRYGPWMDANVVTPISHNRCRVDFDWWLERDTMDRLVGDQAGGSAGSNSTGAGGDEGGGVDEWEFTHPHAAGLSYVVDSLRSSHQVQVEDIQLCEAVQAGLEEPAYGAGRWDVFSEGGLCLLGAGQEVLGEPPPPPVPKHHTHPCPLSPLQVRTGAGAPHVPLPPAAAFSCDGGGGVVVER